MHIRNKPIRPEPVYGVLAILRIPEALVHMRDPRVHQRDFAFGKLPITEGNVFVRGTGYEICFHVHSQGLGVDGEEEWVFGQAIEVEAWGTGGAAVGV